MRKLMFVLALLGAVACGREIVDEVPAVPMCESFEKYNAQDYYYGYENDTFRFEYFYNEEYAYWGGFAHSRIKDADAANGLFANQYAVYNEAAASGDSFLIYYYDSYNEPCDIVLKKDVTLQDVKLNLTTYTYASITDEAINDFARAFVDGDYLKVVFTGMRGNEATGVVECYVVDFRDGKRNMATNWDQFSLTGLGTDYDRVRVTIETTDVGEWGANTPLYICLDDLTYFVEE
ncbi:MAG: DUF4465 domain-containing protein [Alistipes sp.]|nr:DUF4465 domain-containing protein [Alistipes sp.]